ncbi:MAG: hypothetical protein P1V51_24710 [Deltaproteobacteria bacterium]|nr:hypothetical protein [Deltaproteobacteria bacterium]
MERDDQLHCPLFCEENAWHLAGRLLEAGEEAEVLLFSNPACRVLMLQQARGEEAEMGLVVWDYHVVVRAGGLVYDLDTRLPFPMPVEDYLRATFPPQAGLPEAFRAFVRRIPAAAFVARFSSDRSHMVGAVPPEAFPPWPPILPSRADAIPLQRYWDLAQALDDGSEVLPIEGYRDAVSSGRGE